MSNQGGLRIGAADYVQLDLAGVCGRLAGCTLWETLEGPKPFCVTALIALDGINLRRSAGNCL